MWVSGHVRGDSRLGTDKHHAISDPSGNMNSNQHGTLNNYRKAAE